jgi:hypothetical protein
MKKSNNKISDWLEKNGDKEIDKFIEKNLEINEKIRIKLQEKKWDKFKLADEIGISHLEITNWLSGMYNFKLKDIIKIENILEIELL